ncbi:hypothetical protein NUITMVRA1_16130 [Aerococcus viridans]|nr:hypothetical protein NUITMVRA1_16130 [Aerococcus viridans]
MLKRKLSHKFGKTGFEPQKANQLLQVIGVFWEVSEAFDF